MVLSLDDPLFRAYLFYSAVLVLKVMAMVHITRVLRFRKKIFISHEDCDKVKGSIVKYDDPDIERVRRAHLNDLESIIPFLFAALAYIHTSPDVTFAGNLMQLFVGARFAHTFVYAVFVMPQPARDFVFNAGFAVTLYMVLASLLHALFW